MIRKAPSPVPFEGGLECRPEDRAAPALVIEPAGRRFAPPCPSPPRFTQPGPISDINIDFTRHWRSISTRSRYAKAHEKRWRRRLQPRRVLSVFLSSCIRAFRRLKWRRFIQTKCVTSASLLEELGVNLG